MPYEVLARKWRPKNFSELIGQDSVQKTLTNALKQNRLYPVLIFTGPRGTGKTSTARILAKSLRCQKQKDFTPCDNCEDCLLIQESRHLDVMEIDGASNNGVDAIRELRDTVNYMPSTGSWKIYIIDEVHMLSNSAFNALLKTLEEPPKHVVFIMATTENQKIPQTVLSRSQKLDFHLLSPNLIKKQLEQICKKEKVSIKEEILWIIAKQARGSLRDGQSLLDQIITFCGEDLSTEKVTRLLGLSDPHILFSTLQALIHRKEKQMITVIENLRIKGNEPRLFLQSLIEAIRDLLFLKKNPDNNPELVQASTQEIEQLKKEIINTSYEDLHFLFDMLLKGEKEISFCYDSQLVLEVLLLRFCEAPRLENILPLNPLNSKQQEFNSSSQTQAPTNSQKTNTPPQTPTNLQKTNTPPQAPTNSQKTNTPPQTPTNLNQTENTKDQNFKQRFEFLDFLKTKDKTLTALVENLSLKEKSPNHFYFILPENFSYLKNKITSPECHKVLEEQLTSFLNSNERVKIEFLYNKINKPNLREEKIIIEENNLLKQAQTNPFVNEVKNLFSAEIKSVKKSSEYNK